MAGHERKHNACSADIGGCCSGTTYVSRCKVLFVEHVMAHFVCLIRCRLGLLGPSTLGPYPYTNTGAPRKVAVNSNTLIVSHNVKANVNETSKVCNMAADAHVYSHSCLFNQHQVLPLP